MEKSKSLQKLSEIDRDLELWRGTKIRVMLEKEENPDDDYYDYMLIQTPGNNGYMILVNITANNYKEGAVFHNKVEVTSKAKVMVTRDALRKALGPYFENSYLLHRFEDKIIE